MHSIDTGEKIGNSFAVDETNGVYIVTDAALYRFTAGPTARRRSPGARPTRTTARRSPARRRSARAPRRRSHRPATSRSPTTPTRSTSWCSAAATARFVCHAPVFEKGKSNTDQSLIGAGNSFIAENNYGYSGPSATEQGGTTTPGLERVDVDPAGHCNKVWHSDEIAPSVVPKLSLANGIVYTYTKPAGSAVGPVVPHGARLPQRQDAVQVQGRPGARLQQQLRAGHDRPGRDRLRRHAGRARGDARRHAAAADRPDPGWPAAEGADRG